MRKKGRGLVILIFLSQTRLVGGGREGWRGRGAEEEERKEEGEDDKGKEEEGEQEGARGRGGREGWPEDLDAWRNIILGRRGEGTGRREEDGE